MPISSQKTTQIKLKVILVATLSTTLYIVDWKPSYSCCLQCNAHVACLYQNGCKFILLEIQYGRQPPSWLVGGSRGTTHEGPFLVGIPWEKFRHDWRSSVKVMSILIFVDHFWKFYSWAQNFIFGGWLQKFWGTSFTPQEHIPVRNDAFWAVFGPDRTCSVVALHTVSTKKL